MRSHIVVHFPGSFSIFYWQDAKSLSKLKESMKKRFKISPNVQEFVYETNVLNDESYSELYKKRFDEDIDLNLVITGTSVSLDIIKKRREVALTKLKTMVIETGRYLGDANYEKVSIDIKNEVLQWSVADLKNEICKQTSDPLVHAVLINSDDVILADEQLISDAYLDLPNKSGKIIFYQNVPIGETTRGHHNLSQFAVRLPGTEEDLTVDYPLLQIGSFEVSEMKNWIETIFRIPFNEQVLYFKYDRQYSRYSYVRREKFEKGEGRKLTNISLIVHSTSDENLNLVYQQNNVRTSKPIRLTSFQSDDFWTYHYKGRNGQTIDQFITERLHVPKNKQHLFFNDRTYTFDNSVNNNHDTSDNMAALLNSHVANDQQTPFLIFRLIIHADDQEKELLTTIQEQGLSRSRSLIVKHPSNDTVFYETSLSKYQSQNVTCEVIAKSCLQLLPDVFCLLHKGERFEDPKDIRELMLRNDSFNENLILTLAVKPNANENVKKFCQTNDLKSLKEIKIHFLTGQFSVDITSGNVENVEQLKLEIYKTKIVAPHLQVLYNPNQSNEEIDDKVDLISMNNLMTNESFTFNLVVKGGEEFNLELNCIFMEDKFEIAVREIDTIEEIKEMISERSGVPASLISFDVCYDVENEKLPIWEYFKRFNKLGNTKIYVTKRVRISIDKAGVVTKDFSPIRNYETDSVKGLQKRMELLHPKCKVSMQENDLTGETLLKDVGDTEISFLLIPLQKKDTTHQAITNKTECIIS